MTFPALKVWRDTSTRSQCLSCWSFCIELLEQRLPSLRGRASRIEKGIFALVSPLRISEADRYELRVAAMYHDIGLLGVSDDLILNQGQLSPQQQSCFDVHTHVGGRLLAKAFPDFPNAIEAVWYHHERPDGKGPHGLTGDQIPQMAGIIALVNMVEVMVNGVYPYKKPLTPAQVQEEVNRLSGTALLPTTTVAFRRVAEQVCDAVLGYTPPASMPKASKTAPVSDQCIAPPSDSTGCVESAPITKATDDAPSPPQEKMVLRIQPRPHRDLHALEPLITKSQLKKVIDEQTELKPLAPVVQNVMAVTSNPQCSVDDVTAVVQQDPALAIRVLRLANSSAYWRGRMVKYVKDAVSRIGVQEVRNTVIALGVFDQYADGETHDNQTLLFWEHSLACGLLASAIARTRHGPVQHDSFLVGMLHDMGQTILTQCVPEIYQEVKTTADRLGVPLQDVEAKLLGMTHGDVFRYVFERWRFTAFMIEPIVHHQKCLNQIRQIHRDHQQNTMTLALADRLSQALLLGSSGIDMLSPVHELVEALGIQPASLQHLITDVTGELSDLKLALFSRTPSNNWPHQPSVIQNLFTQRPRVLYVGPDDPADVWHLFFQTIAAFHGDQPPNLGVLYLRDPSDLQACLHQYTQRTAASLPVILISQEEAPNTRDTLLDNRPHAVLQSPVSVSTLVSVTNRLLTDASDHEKVDGDREDVLKGAHI